MSDTFERKVITPAEREARKLFREADAAKAMTEHERAQKAFHENRERLKALRLARETQQTKDEQTKDDRPADAPELSGR